MQHDYQYKIALGGCQVFFVQCKKILIRGHLLRICHHFEVNVIPFRHVQYNPSEIWVVLRTSPEHSDPDNGHD